QVRGNHAQHGEEREKGERRHGPCGVGEQDRGPDSEYDEDDRDDPEPPAEAAHLRPQRTGPIYALASALIPRRGTGTGSPSAHANGSPPDRRRWTGARQSPRP